MRTVAFLPAWRDACALYRMFIPSLHVPNSMFIFSQGAMPLEVFAHVDVVVVQRIATKSNLLALQILKKAGIKIVYDLDDNIWNIPRYNPAREAFEQLKYGLNVCAKESDVLTVSTEPLKLAARKYMPEFKHRRIEVVPNSIDFNYFGERMQRRDGFFTVAWAGSNTHAEDVKKVFNLMPAILEKEKTIRFETFGHALPDALKGHERAMQGKVVEVSEYPSRLRSWGWDLSLAPLEYNEFCRSKSNIKILEAATLGIPILVSDIAAYSDFMKMDSELRYLLCSKPTDWSNKIVELKNEPELRERLVKKMRRVVRERFDGPKIGLRWQEVFESL